MRSLLLTVICLSLGQRESLAEGPPNIVFIMVDDMGWADLSCYGSDAIETPHLDRLAAQGLRFSQAYSGSTVCGPARSTLLTGTHMGHTSVRLNTGGVSLRDEDVTIAEVLAPAGYVSGGFGKWGLGELGTEGVPERQGFDTFYGYYHQIHAHYHLPEYLIRNGEKVALPGNEGFYKEHPHGLAGDGGFPRSEAGRIRQFAPELIVDATKDFIKEHANADEPFFCYAAWTPPHGEYKIPEDDPAWIKYADRDWPVRARVVAAYDTMIDRHVGEILTLLDELGIADETIVFFCSDHGADKDYDGVLDSCGPLRGQKRSMYEGGLRVPLIARWPGQIKAGTESDHLCYFPDILPTLAELAGAETSSTTDGISIVPTLLGQGPQPTHEFLYWDWARYDWGKRQLSPNGLMQAVRQGDLKAVRHHQDSPIELYDLSNDIGESNDLASERPEDVARFARLMDEAHSPMRQQAEPARVDGKPFR